MNNCERVLIEILKASLNKQKYILDSNDNIKWDDLIKEAQEHKISSLVYHTLERSVFDLIEPHILNEWKKEVITSNLIEIKHDKDTISIIEDFNKNGINYICLKGIYLKDLYPKRELRTMSDIDIIVNMSDYERAKEILIKQGYEYSGHGNSVHEVLNKYGCIQVELHNALVNEDVVKMKYKEFETNIWNNAGEFKLFNKQTKILGKDDFLLHLIFHMIVHAKYMGFGIRQLYDLCLYVKYNKDEIDWIKFKDTAYKYGILEFSQGIFCIINKIFKMDIDSNFLKDIKFSEKDIYLLLDSIFESGVYGRKNLDGDFSSLYRDVGFRIGKQGIYINLVKFIFPKINSMGEKYNYAKKYKILAPIAWTHRIIFGGLIKNKISYNIKNIKYSIGVRIHRNRINKIFKIPM